MTKNDKLGKKKLQTCEKNHEKGQTSNKKWQTSEKKSHKKW